MRIEIVGGPHDGAFLAVPVGCSFHGYIHVHANKIYIVEKEIGRAPKLIFWHERIRNGSNP